MLELKHVSYFYMTSFTSYINNAVNSPYIKCGRRVWVIVVVQDYVSGQACCVNQYHYKSQLIHTTGKTWYIVLCQHTMYVISLSNISIKANVKQIAGSN
jgi:hypothetical protein